MFTELSTRIRHFRDLHKGLRINWAMVGLVCVLVAAWAYGFFTALGYALARHLY